MYQALDCPIYLTQETKKYMQTKYMNYILYKRHRFLGYDFELIKTSIYFGNLTIDTEPNICSTSKS